MIINGDEDYYVVIYKKVCFYNGIRKFRSFDQHNTSESHESPRQSISGRVIFKDSGESRDFSFVFAQDSERISTLEMGIRT